MSRRASVVLLLSLLLVAATACRSRPTPPPEPQAAPPVAPAPPAETAVTVPSREGDFVQTPAPDRDVLSADIVEANRVARDRGWIRDAFFGYDASTLDADAQEALRQSASWLRENRDYRIRIEGHCDSRGTEQYNLALGERRAETAAAFLASLGVERSRIETVSYGEERPFEEGESEAVWAQNRRAHLVLAGRR